MKWLNRIRIPEMAITEHLPPDHKTSIEIVAHKHATKEVLEKARQANTHLKDLLEENGFTLKIFMATGGTHSKSKRAGS